MSSETNLGSALPLRLWARIEYDGTDFFGFQLQSRGRTVQGELEAALETVTGAKTRVIGAGRTDRGVHAAAQIVAFEVLWRHSLADLQRALNASLAADVSILAMGPAADGFHPRFSARSRTYRYTILNRPWRSALQRRTAWHLEKELDVSQMSQASRYLVGSHDFSTFGRAPGRAADRDTRRTVIRAEWQRRGSLLTFDIEANAFLYRMVRSIVGTLVLVGWGQLSAEEFKEILEARDRSRIKGIAPAHGLCLVEVNYAACGGIS